MNFYFCKGIKVTPESLFSRRCCPPSAFAIISKLPIFHLRKLSACYRVNEKLPNPLCKVSKGICHLTFTEQSGMSKPKKGMERNKILKPLKRGERKGRTQPKQATVRCKVCGKLPGSLPIRPTRKRTGVSEVLRFLPALRDLSYFVKVTTWIPS